MPPIHDSFSDSLDPEDWNPWVLNNFLRERNLVVNVDKQLAKQRGTPGKEPESVNVSIGSAKGLLGHTWTKIIQGHDLAYQLYGLEEFAAERRTVEEKRKLYIFTHPKKPESEDPQEGIKVDSYPPHLQGIPEVDFRPPIGGPDALFNFGRFLNTQALLGNMLNVMNISGSPGANARTIEDIEWASRAALAFGQGVQDTPNISERTDWYTDAVFAQQFFTGPNPMIIKRAPLDKVQDFRKVAEAQKIAIVKKKNELEKDRGGKSGTLEDLDKKRQDLDAREASLKAWYELLEAQEKLLKSEKGKPEHEKTSSLWIADYSYIRSAAGLDSEEDITSNFWPGKPPSNSDIHGRYGCAPIALFELQQPSNTASHRRTRGYQLHPLAIAIDVKKTLPESVIIFNRRVKPDDKPAGPASTDPTHECYDWPWRYAKTCVMVADWLDHEIRAHLTETHLIQEPLIVGIQRSFGDAHPVYELLHSHWVKTLSVNASARRVLVPSVVTMIYPFNWKQTCELIGYYYKNFDFQKRYVPDELRGRGFPLRDLDLAGVTLQDAQLAGRPGEFQNFGYGRNIGGMWQVVKNYVKGFLEGKGYEFDKDQEAIKSWISEMRTKEFAESDPKRYGADMPTFPEKINSLGQLIDVLTMCIHIASPQHTAINYLQNYYQAFVIHKPPALFQKPPNSLEELDNFQEQNLFAAFPVGNRHDTQLMRQWLLASHLPWLLSYQVGERETLLNYARTTAATDDAAKQSAREFEEDLLELGLQFARHSADITVKRQDRKPIKYEVMNPEVTAVSILI